jgi:hypothetical protein
VHFTAISLPAWQNLGWQVDILTNLASEFFCLQITHPVHIRVLELLAQPGPLTILLGISEDHSQVEAS